MITIGPLDGTNARPIIEVPGLLSFLGTGNFNGEVKGINDHPDIGRVLAGLADVRDFDELEIGFVHGRLEGLVAIPVAIGFLDHDAALGKQTLENWLDIELLVIGIANAEGDVLEVTEERHAGVVAG